MRLVFGVVSLVVALAIVGVVARRQLQAVSASGPAPTGSQTPAQQPHRLQQQVQDDITRSMQQAAQRASDAP